VRSGPALALAALAACGEGDDPADPEPIPAAVVERSLVWVDPIVVDDPGIVGLARVMGAIAPDGHGGQALVDWFERFGTTAHSERLGPALLVAELRATHGADPTAWDLDALPFAVTAVHNRIDLAPRDGGCGQLRVSLASTHAVYAPLHLIFLFRQAPQPDDVDGDEIHCLGTAERWARLGELDGAAFADAARAWLDAALTRDAFLLAESVELTVSPWEWRQWTGVSDWPAAPDNPPLFQTVDTAALDQPGALRDDFVAWATDNAAGLAARTVEIPARFRAPSARVPPGVPRDALDLDVAGYPDLAAAIEIVGCPACHTTGAEFVHTTPQRTFSDFYERELDARAARLDLMNQGADVGVPPFGPLQTSEGP
jgi:hypothetical protein